MYEKVTIVVADNNFKDKEYADTKKAMDDYGFEVSVVSKSGEEANGVDGMKLSIDKSLAEVEVGNLDALVFIGGSGAADYFDDEVALSLVKQAVEADKVVGAICIAPSILANAGVLSGVTATSFLSEEENLKKHGANYTGASAESDGKIITANGPSAAEEFGEKIALRLQAEF